MPGRTQTLQPHELDAMVRAQIAVNRSVIRESQAQATVDDAIECCYDEGFVELAASIMMVSAGCIAGPKHVHGMLTALLQYAVDYDIVNDR